MNTALMFSSATDEWATPRDLFVALHREFNFSLDAAARRENCVHTNYLGPDQMCLERQDGLSSDWRSEATINGGDPTVFLNPPYSRGLQGKFIAKAALEARWGVTTVALLPARTDTKAFHAYIYDASCWQPREGVKIRLLPGRLKFGGAVNSAPFPSMVVIIRGMASA